MPSQNPLEPEEDPPAVVQFPTPQAPASTGEAAPLRPAAPAAAPAAPAASPAAPAGAPGVYQPNLTPRAPGAPSLEQSVFRDNTESSGFNHVASPIGRAPLSEADKDPYTTHFGTMGAAVGGSAAPPKMAADLRTGASESMHDFAAQDPNIKGPSDFVGFDRFAGLNDDLMRTIADRNSDTSSAARQTALGFLSDAENEATADTPVEQTASYKKYLDAMKKAGDGSRSFSAKTGNPYEDALRGIYSGAQTARDTRLQGNAVNRGNVSAGNRNRFNATAKAQADAAAAAAAANEAASKAAGRAATRAERADVAAEGRADNVDKRTGRSVDDEYTTRTRRAGYGRNTNNDITDY